MNDHIASIHQHPVALRQAFHVDAGMPHFAQLFLDLIGYGAHMPLGAPGGDHHVIGDRCFLRHIDGNHVLGLGVVQRGEHEVEKFRRAGLCHHCCFGLARGTPSQNMNAQRLFLSMRAGTPEEPPLRRLQGPCSGQNGNRRRFAFDNASICPEVPKFQETLWVGVSVALLRRRLKALWQRPRAASGAQGR